MLRQDPPQGRYYPHQMREPRIYHGHERPDVEVLVDGQWLQGELRAWLPVGVDEWVANVQYRPAGTATRHIGDFAAEDVRPDTYEDPRLSDPGGSIEE